MNYENDIEDFGTEENYNRERTLAILTGVVCALIFLAGTALGATHSLKTLGIFGLLSVACYAIADIAVAWASYIDYKEPNGTPMNWTAWIVKYVISAYLLVSGGAIAYLMIENAELETGANQRAQTYQQAFDNCMKQPKARATQCRKFAENLNNNETQLAKDTKTQRETSAGWVHNLVTFPLFKYMPGFLGLGGLLALTFMDKLSPSKKQKKSTSLPYADLPEKAFRMRQRQEKAAFDLKPKNKTLPAVSYQGTKSPANFRFKQSGNGYVISFRYEGRELYGVKLPAKEAEQVAGYSFTDLAKLVISRRRAENRDDSTAKIIENWL